MRVLHLISSGGMYGAEAVILNLSRVLNETGEHSSVLGVFANQGAENLQLHEAAQLAGIESYPVVCRGQIDRTMPQRIRDLVQRTGADSVHAHGYKADVYAFWALHKTRTPLVSTCHNWLDDGFAVRLYGALDRRVLRHFSGVVAVSEEVRQRLLRAGVAPERAHLIRNGVDLRPFAEATRLRAMRQEASAPLRLGLVGRLSPEKGIDLLLNAVSLLLREGFPVECLIAGEGPARQALEQQIQALHLDPYVRLLGQKSDMPAFYAATDVLVSASYREGLPMALLEGLASGLPTVATAVGSVPSVVLPETTGLLVPPGDAASLGDALRRLVADPALRQQLGRAAQHHIAQQFSAERMAADYLQLYRAALVHTGGARAGNPA